MSTAPSTVAGYTLPLGYVVNVDDTRTIDVANCGIRDRQVFGVQLDARKAAWGEAKRLKRRTGMRVASTVDLPIFNSLQTDPRITREIKFILKRRSDIDALLERGHDSF